MVLLRKIGDLYIKHACRSYTNNFTNNGKATQDGFEGFFLSQGTASKVALLLGLGILYIWLFCCTSSHQESSGVGRRLFKHISVIFSLLQYLLPPHLLMFWTRTESAHVTVAKFLPACFTRYDGI